MAVFDAPASTYSDTTPHKRAITDVISLIDPVDVPLITALGGLDGAASKFRFTNWPSKTVEWLQDDHLPLSSTFNAADTLTSTVTTITVADGTLLQAGDILLAGTEQMWVSSVSTDTITVTRGAFAAATTQASLATFYIVGQARVEGAESVAVGMVDRYVGSNVTQIFHREIKVTRSHAKLSQYGIANEMAYQKDKAIPDLLRRMEKHLLYNASVVTGSSTAARAMGGVQAFVSTNKVSGASLAQSAFENALLSCYNAGGMGPWLAIMAPVNAQKVKNWYDTTGVASATILRVDRETSTVGMKVQQIVTPFGDVNIVMDRWAPTTLIYLIDPAHAGLATYDPFGWEPLAKTGDYEREEVVGEFTFCLRQEKAHALLTNVS